MQIRNRKIVLSFLFAVLFMGSCSHKIESEMDEGMGEVVFNLSTVFTKAEAEDADINVDDFKIEILNSKGIIFKRWKTYAEYKENPRVQMNANGSIYTIRATYGDPKGAGFEAFCFKGETQFTVKPQSVTEVSVVCKMANVKIGVMLGDTIKKNYTDIKIRVSNTYGSLSFADANIGDNGYLPAEPISVNVEMVNLPSYADTSIRKYYFKHTDIQADPGDHLVLTIDTKEHPTGDVAISITVNDSTENFEETVDLPPYTLPFDAPAITLTGFGPEGNLEYIEGCTPEDATVHIDAEGRIKSCKMDIESAYLAKLDFPKTVDFLNLEETTAKLLKKYGVVYPSDMAGYMVAGITLKDLAGVFEYDEDAAANTHTFTFTVTDSLDKEVTQVIRFIPAMADKSIDGISEADVRARRANATISTTNGNVENLYPEISKDGGKTWNRATYNTVSKQDGVHKLVLTELEGATEYLVRATYNKYSSSTVKIQTEAAAQVPNSDMESWTEGQVKSYELVATYQYTYYPWANEASKVWDTNNSETTKASGTPAYLEKKCFPMVSFMPGREGGKAAQIMAIAVNGGNTDGTSLSDAVQGELFIGSYGGTRNTGFGSRPDKMSFWYKYDIRTDDDHTSDTYSARVILYNGTEKIGEGLLEQTHSSDVTGWTEATVDISYTDLTKKATAIYIQFLQSTNSKPVYNMNVEIVYGGSRTAKVHGGSVLTVDDIKLIYE